MVKRQRLIYDGTGLTQSLKQSTDQGVDALFPPPDDGAVPGGTDSSQRPSPSPRRPIQRTRKKSAHGQPSRKHKHAASNTAASPAKAVMTRAAGDSQHQPRAQSIDQWVDPPLNRPVNRSVDPQLTGKVVDRPVAFYLPEIINEKIDEAVDYIAKRHRVKVDRSAVVSAILGNPALWEPEALNQLVDKTIGQLTSRLTNRLTKM